MRYVIELFPAILGVIVALVRWEAPTKWIERADEWAINKHEQYKGATGAFARLMRPVFHVFRLLHVWTEPIDNDHLRAGVRLAGGLYLLFAVGALAVYAIISLIMLAILLFVLYAVADNAFGGGTVRNRTWSRPSNSGDTDYKNYDSSDRQTGHSRQRTGLLGEKITDHFENAGTQTGHSDTREAVLGGTVSDHYDGSGKQSGHSVHREDLSGETIIDHYDSSGNKTGHSRVRKDAFGNKVIDHYDASGKQVGHSTE